MTIIICVDEIFWYIQYSLGSKHPVYWLVFCGLKKIEQKKSSKLLFWAVNTNFRAPSKCVHIAFSTHYICTRTNHLVYKTNISWRKKGFRKTRGVTWFCKSLQLHTQLTKALLISYLASLNIPIFHCKKGGKDCTKI